MRCVVYKIPTIIQKTPANHDQENLTKNLLFRDSSENKTQSSESATATFFKSIDFETYIYPINMKTQYVKQEGYNYQYRRFH